MMLFPLSDHALDCMNWLAEREAIDRRVEHSRLARGSVADWQGEGKQAAIRHASPDGSRLAGGARSDDDLEGQD